VMREAGARPQGKAQARGKVEEGDGPVLELAADDAGRGPAQPVAVEGDGAVEVVDSEGDEGDACLHGGSRRGKPPMIAGPAYLPSLTNTRPKAPTLRVRSPALVYEARPSEW